MAPKTTEGGKQHPAKIAVSVPAAEVVAEKPADLFLRKGEVLDAIVAETQVKRADARAVLDAFLMLLGDRLEDQQTCQLPPLGKVKPVKSVPAGQGGTAITVKIRRPNS